MDETVAAELSAIRESIANLASRVDELVSASFVGIDEMRGATEPLADEITKLHSAVVELAKSGNSDLDDASKRNAWVDAVLNRYFFNDRPSN